jgi:very-short-patch-repair endonuclease
VENFRTEFGYRCVCTRETTTPEELSKHGKRCSSYKEQKSRFKEKRKKEYVRQCLIENKLKCQFCEFYGHVLTEHLKLKHGIKKEDYKGELLSEKAKENIKKRNKRNGDWINRRKETGESLIEFKNKLSKSVSESIMSNEKERQRRSEMLAEINKRDESRKRSSTVAQRTSKRKDLLEKRYAKLKKWREENREEFFERCTKQLLKHKSKPEKILYKHVTETYPEYKFKNNCFIKDDIFCLSKSGRKQIDIFSERYKVIIEFDGIQHFKQTHINQNLEETKEKDRQLNEYAKINNMTLIRISHDQFSYRMGGIFINEVFDNLSKILSKENNTSDRNIYLLGDLYDK